jgi:hypothetical protein
MVLLSGDSVVRSNEGGNRLEQVGVPRGLEIEESLKVFGAHPWLRVPPRRKRTDTGPQLEQSPLGVVELGMCPSDTSGEPAKA